MISRRKFIRNAATGLMVPTLMSSVVRGTVPLPVGFFKSAASAASISAAATAALNDWITRVQGQSSDVTIAGTQTAVGQYIDGLMTDGVWSKIVRMSIYAGDDLNALKAPLVNGGPSATDSLVSFVAGDYSQAVGLTGNLGGVGTGKYIQTGLFWNSGLMSDTDIHVSLYERTAPDTGICLQCGGPPFAALDADNATAAWYLNSGVSFISVADTGIGHYVGSRISSSDTALYRNGALIASGTTAGGGRLAYEFMIHCQNFGGTSNVSTARTVEGYSMGAGLTATEAANFTTRYSTLRTALGR